MYAPPYSFYENQTYYFYLICLFLGGLTYGLKIDTTIRKETIMKKPFTEHSSDKDYTDEEEIELDEKVIYELQKNQELFLLGKEQLNYYLKIKETRPLTTEEKFEVNEIKTKLYESVKKYSISLMNAFIKGYKTDSDARTDIEGAMTDKFFDEFEKYSSEFSPTSYYKNYFREKVREYINKHSQHLSTNDAQSLKIIRSIQREFEADGIEPTAELVSTRSKQYGKFLSVKTVNKVLNRAENSGFTSISEATDNGDMDNDPLEMEIKEQRSNNLHRIMEETLTPEEIEFFLNYIRPDTNKTSSYKDMMKIYNLTEHEVKSKVSEINSKLMSRINELEQINNVSPNYNSTITLQDSAGDEVEQDIISGFSD